MVGTPKQELTIKRKGGEVTKNMNAIALKGFKIVVILVEIHSLDSLYVKLS